MVSEYNLKLIDKKLLQKKLKEYIELAVTVSDEEQRLHNGRNEWIDFQRRVSFHLEIIMCTDS